MTVANIIQPVITREDFIVRVEHFVNNDGLTYLDAIMYVSNDLDIDPEDIAKMVTGPLKDKLEHESIRRNSIRGVKSNTATLYD